MNAIDFYHTMDEHLQSKFELLKSKSLNIDLTRGKPGADQLDLSNELLSINVPSHDENSVAVSYTHLTLPTNHDV